MSDMEPTPMMRGQDFGLAALACDFACPACANGKVAVLQSGSADFIGLKVGEQVVPITNEDAEFLAGVLLAYARRNTSRGTVKVPDTQPNSIYGEKP